MPPSVATAVRPGTAAGAGGGVLRDEPTASQSARRFARAVRCLLFALAATTLAGCAWVGDRLHTAIYRPTRAVPDGFAGLANGDATWFVPVGNPAPTDQQVQIWWMPAKESRAPTLLYLHGTFRNLYHNHPKMQAIREAGYSVVGVEYRGWGESTPIVPSESTIYADAEAGWRELVRLQPDPSRRVIYGHSLGGAVAVDLAARKAADGGYAGLILESTFTCLPEVAGTATSLAVPLAWLSGQHFDSQSKIGAVRVPVLFMHGTADRTVPFELGQRLFGFAGEPKTLVEFQDGGHSRLHRTAPERYRAALADFAEKLFPAR
jgi:hypothetical protein